LLTKPLLRWWQNNFACHLAFNKKIKKVIVAFRGIGIPEGKTNHEEVFP